MSNSIQFNLNGELAKADCRADTTVLEWLRSTALLRGTKEGCAEGDCGACSILLKRQNSSGSSEYQPANSCILLMGQLEGAAIVTVEGLAALKPQSTTNDEPGHAVQKRMAENGSSQCGFCTPGIVVALAGLLEGNDKPDDTEIHDALAGNLCRCTGYRPIVEAAHAAAQESKGALPTAVIPDPKPVTGTDDSQFYLPKSLKELLNLRADIPDAILLAGGTDLSLDIAHARARWENTILTRHVAELRTIETNETEIAFGGAVTWEEALPHLLNYWPSFATLVRRFGSTQIRSMGTIAGNLGTASPIGDGAPALLALDAELTLANKSGERRVALSDYFTGYRKTIRKNDEIISAIHVPLPDASLAFRTYKISKRYDQDISTVCGAFALKMDGETIVYARLAYGGMAATPLRVTEAENALMKNVLDSDTIAATREAIANAFQPMSDMRGSAKYRLAVAQNLVDRLALDLAGETVEVMAL